MYVYSSFTTQVYAWAHYIIAFSLVYVAVPLLFFRRVNGDITDRLLANYVRMVFYVISMTYVLVALKLYEVMGMGCVGLLFLAWRQLRGNAAASIPWSSLVARLYEVVELPGTMLRFLYRLPEIKKQWWHLIQPRLQLRVSIKTIRYMMLMLVLFTSAAIRLYDAVYVAAPEESDGDVTLEWTKYISERILFHDGIYPQGWYMYLASLGKFAVIDTLFIIKFSGPLACFMIVLLMCMLLYKFTESTVGAIVAGLVYGVLGYHLLGDDWTRQAASNAQEFGFLFTFPLIYFLRRYFERGRLEDFWVAFACLCDIGLIHSLSYELAAMAGICVVLAAVTIDFRRLKSRILIVLLGGMASGIVSLLPVGLGIVLRIPLNSAATTYLVSSSAASLPRMNFFDDLAVCSIGLLLATALRQRSMQQNAWSTMIIGLWGVMCFSVYEFGGVLTHSTVLSSRMLDLWAVTAATAIGMAAQTVYNFILRFRYHSLIEGIGWIGCIGAIGVLSPPALIIPYTVQWNDDIDAYLKINHEFRFADGGYMIVAQDFEYDLVSGNGFRMDPRQFLTMYDPKKPPLTRYGSSSVDRSIAPYVFLYYNKKIFEVSKTNGIYPIERPIYTVEEQNKKLMNQWLREFRAANGVGAVKVFYNGPHVEVFELTIKPVSSQLLD